MLLKHVEIDGALVDVRIDGDQINAIAPRLTSLKGEPVIDGQGGALAAPLEDVTRFLQQREELGQFVQPRAETLAEGPSNQAGAVVPAQARDVVEVPARVDRDGPEPLTQRPLAPELLGLAQHVAAYERLAAEAAVTGEVATVRKALLAHPLIGQYEYADELAERLLSVGAEHLPQFPRGVTA